MTEGNQDVQNVDVKTDVNPTTTPTTVPNATPDNKDASTQLNPQDKAEPKSYWPEDWRTRASKGDEKELKRLERFASPDAVLDAYRNMEKKLSSMETVKPFPADGTDEEKNNWRTANNIPLDPKAYDLSDLKDFITDDNKPVIEGYLELAHKTNTPPEHVKQLLGWYFDQQNQGIERFNEIAQQKTEQAKAALQEEWGSDYKRNLNIIHGYLGEDMANQFAQARLADGTFMIDNPEVMRFLAEKALEHNPVATVVPNTGGNPADTIDNEIAKIKKLVANSDSEYWKGSESAKLQKRFGELLAARERLKK